MKYFLEIQKSGRGFAAETQRVLRRIKLWHDFSEKQKQECEQHRHEKKVKQVVAPTYRLPKEIVEQHNDCHVHKIIGNQYGGEQPFGVFTQQKNFIVRLAASLFYDADFARRQ